MTAFVAQLEIDQDIQPVIEFMVRAHKGQIRKGSGLPYSVHPMSVLARLGDWEIDCYNCWKAALCHDVLEDCPEVTFDQLVGVIGEQSANIVQELTFKPNPNSVMPEPFQKSEYMKSFANKSLNALVIKVADRMCNTMDFISTDPNYASKYWKKAESLFETMLIRKEEILTEFGRSSFPRMRYNQTCLSDMLTQ